MVSPSRTSATRRRREDAGKLFTGVLILLGLVASVFLVFSDSVQMVRVGLVAALWAAAIGALAATRYRRESAVDKAKIGDLQKVYHLQLEREVAARREYELGVEQRVRQEVGADAEQMAALRAELTVLRESLQRLFEGQLPHERPALHADAFRVQELPSRQPRANNTAANGNWGDTGDHWDPWSAPIDDDVPDPRSRVTPVFEPDHPEPPAFASPYDDPVTAETMVVTDQEFDMRAAKFAEPESESGAEPVADTATKRTEPITGVEREPLTQVPWFETDLPPAGNAEAPSAGSADVPFTGSADPAPAPPAPRLAPEPTPAPMGTASARRRRRAEEDDTDSAPRLSVAEIMANLRSEGK
ncbi:DUF6779 domain-containing protein [Nocardia sp. IFM 10818]